MSRSITPTSRVGDALVRVSQGADATTTAYEYEPDFWAAHAIREAYESYQDVVDVKPKSLEKFGENLLVGTSEAALMGLPAGVTFPPLATTNAVTHVSSSSASDTGERWIEGHTVSGGLFTFVRQSVTLSGQDKVALATPICEPTRYQNLTATNDVGDIYVYEDDTLSAGVPTTAAKVHLVMRAVGNSDIGAENQSLKARTIISNNDYIFITQIHASVNKKTAAGAVIRLRIQSVGGAWRTIFKRGINSLGSDLDREIRPYLVVPQNSRVMMTAEADGASTPISGGWNSLLATVRVDT